MGLYSLVNKPAWLTTTQKAATAATSRGWVYTRPDGTAEPLVAISNMTTKMIPTIRSVTTSASTYEIGTAVRIDFTVNFNRAIKSSDITSASTLTFLIDETEYEAAYQSKTSTSVTFRYTFPTNGDEYDIPEVAVLGISSIDLNTGEHIYLDFADSNISANLTLPSETVTAAITQKVPAITGVTTDKASYTIGVDTEVEFTVTFGRDVKTQDLTSATILNFTINSTDFEAEFDSISGNDVIFVWTIPDPYLAAATTVMFLNDITLGEDEDILLDSSTNTISADLTGLPSHIHATIVVA